MKDWIVSLKAFNLTRNDTLFAEPLLEKFNYTIDINKLKLEKEKIESEVERNNKLLEINEHFYEDRGFNVSDHVVLIKKLKQRKSILT